MIGLEWLGVTTLAFLAPLPPERPERQTPEPLRGSEWAAVVVIGSIFLMTVVPMVTIWSFHRPRDADRARCAPTDRSGPYRCGGGAAPP